VSATEAAAVSATEAAAVSATEAAAGCAGRAGRASVRGASAGCAWRAPVGGASRGSTGCARCAGSARVIMTARTTMITRMMSKSVGSGQWQNRAVVAAVPVRIRTPSRIPGIARTPLGERPGLSLSLVGSYRADPCQPRDHHRCCRCRTCLHVSLLLRLTVYSRRSCPQHAVRSVDSAAKRSDHDVVVFVMPA
jgi:hypothetical protein